MRRLFLPAALTPTLALLLLPPAPSQQPAQTAVEPVDFNRDIRPILADKCFQCHGPDGSARKAKLRLDVRAVAFAPRGDRPPAIVAGDVDGSELVRRITHADPKERMPPASFEKQLDARERDLLVEWIRQGAAWEEHWAFIPPKPVGGTDELGAIDRFVEARLRSTHEKLRPAPAADKRTLIRRVSLDLIGLPPTLEEVRAFAADKSADAYEKVVDRLLASPSYGEHMARFWLDAARYGDTHGLHLDNYREMWLYRDWVIRAFNENMPFDCFTIEQIAGDMLPDATLDQKVASGFNRCHVTTNEGGSIEEEVYVRNVIDRVSTTGTVFLGLTLGCAVCHDHKFDPLTQREFYQMFAFFNNLDGKPMDGNAKVHAPVVRVPSPEQTAGLAKLVEDRKAAEAEIHRALTDFAYTEPQQRVPQQRVPQQREPQQREPQNRGTQNRETESRSEGTRQTIVWIDDALPAGAAVGGDGLQWVGAQDGVVHSGLRAMRRKSDGNQQHFFKNADRKLRVGAGDVLFAWIYLDPTDRPKQVMLQWNGDGENDWNHRAYWGENRIDYGRDKTTERRRIGDLPEAGKWFRLAVPAAKVGLRPGMAVHGVAFTQFEGTAYWDTVGIETVAIQEPEDYVWVDDEAPDSAKQQGEGKHWQWVAPATTDRAGEHPAALSGVRILRRRGKGLIQDYFTGAAAPLRLQAGDRLFAHVWLDPRDPPKSVQLQFHDGNWNHRVRYGAPAHGPNLPNGADFVGGPLPATGQWVRLEVPIEKVGLAPGRKLDGWAFTQVDGTVYWDKAGVRTWGPPDNEHLVSLRAWEQIAADDAAVPAAVRKALGVASAERTAAQTKIIRDHYVRFVFTGSRQVFDPLHAKLAAVDKQKKALEAAIPTTLVMKERAEPRPAYVLNRGLYDQRGDPVQRATPAALPPMPANLPADRLGLARWLVDPDHPLTARVTVNRFWQQVFGTGLVKTSEDFGNQGERPSHPQLLDWLATRFVADGWDVKRFMKRMVMSSTYRQSSHATPELLLRDPNNRLLARGPRFRLDAEVLRDQALVLSGLLVPEIGGPGVKPPQPDGLWKAVGYVGSNTDRFRPDKGPDKVYRRSLYTFWKRTSPPPQMSTFDAPSREDCRVRRERTNTPLQALLLMNDPQYVEAARCLAQRILREVDGDDRERAGWAFELATARPADSRDLDEILALLHKQRAEFHGNPDQARALIAVGESAPDDGFGAEELAAWTMVANLILNLDEVITKG